MHVANISTVGGLGQKRTWICIWVYHTVTGLTFSKFFIQTINISHWRCCYFIFNNLGKKASNKIIKNESSFLDSHQQKKTVWCFQIQTFLFLEKANNLSCFCLLLKGAKNDCQNNTKIIISWPFYERKRERKFNGEGYIFLFDAHELVYGWSNANNKAKKIKKRMRKIRFLMFTESSQAGITPVKKMGKKKLLPMLRCQWHI